MDAGDLAPRLLIDYQALAGVPNSQSGAPHAKTLVPSNFLAGGSLADYRNLWNHPPNARIVSDNKPEQAFGELIRSVGGLAARLR